jgi:hypothetical protein
MFDDYCTIMKLSMIPGSQTQKYKNKYICMHATNNNENMILIVDISIKWNTLDI